MKGGKKLIKAKLVCTSEVPLLEVFLNAGTSINHEEELDSGMRQFMDDMSIDMETLKGNSIFVRDRYIYIYIYIYIYMQ